MSELVNNFSPELFHFQDSSYLYLLLVVFSFLLFEFFPGRRFSFSINKLKKFIDPHLIPHLLQGSENKTKNIVKSAYVMAICIFLVIALANPRWNFEDVESYKGNVNIIFAVDLSKSMDAEDEKPSRLERVKQEINDILDVIGSANVAIIGFAENAHIIAPLTEDKEALREFISGISTDMVKYQGSNIEAAIEQAHFMFQSMQGGINYLVVMSDGDFNTNTNMTNFRMKLKDAILISYGFGTFEGAPIKQQDGSFIKHDNKIVISKYNESNMKLLSGDSNYIKSSYLDNDIKYLADKVQQKRETEVSKYQTMRVWQDRFYIPLAIAMVMLLPFFRKGSIFPVVFFILLTPQFAKADSEKNEFSDLDFLKIENIKKNLLGLDLFRNEDQKAVNHFEERDYDNAIKGFSSDYNKGVAAYRQKDFESAGKYFSNAVENEFSETNIDALYNLGNAELMQLKAEDAIKAYEKLLKLDENHADAKHNLEIAKQLLEKQKQEKEKNKKENKDKNKEEQNKDEQNSQDDKQEQNDDGQQDKQDSVNQNGGRNEDGKNEEQNKEQGGNNKDEQNDLQENQLDEGQSDEENEGNKSQNAIDLGDSMKQNSSNNERSELDKEAQKIFKNLKSDTGEFIRNRVRFNDAAKIKESGEEGNDKPW